ncbi:MAG: TetR/AcrR family transcriptional regulator [bacterium]|nr:TetR/AcrR family transcriptional regulator [bacterium]
MVSELRKRSDAERRARTRLALVEAAGKVFVRRGYHDTQISDIVSEIGVGQGTFYRHFDGKRAIAGALFEQLAESLLAEFTPMSAPLPSGVEEYREASVAAAVRAAQALRSKRHLALLFLRQGASIDLELDGQRAEILDRFAALARFHLDRAIAGGFARACDSEIVSQAIVGMALRQLDLWLGGSIDDHQVEAAARELVEFAFRGFGP